MKFPPGNISYTCETFNTDTGQWETSHTFDDGISDHVAWRTSQGLLLMGGFSTDNFSNLLKTTTLLLPGGGHQPGPFELIR